MVLGAMVAMFSSGDVSKVKAVVHPDYLDHQGLGGEPVRGPSGFAKVVATARSSHAGLEVSIQDLRVAGDRAAARLQWHGTRLDGGVLTAPIAGERSRHVGQPAERTAGNVFGMDTRGLRP